ncbi:hypothetical protein BDR07DRAFT_1418231 [Suillus spraguei]|nr:hypothetical protein BDR07DRAFT_1418231 [Suillus spraguei]
MAKQKHGPGPDRQQRRHSSVAIACPSSSVLSILATIAASSQTVDGSPLPRPTPPPSFLCPFIDQVDTCGRHTTPTTSYSSTTTSFKSSKTTTKYAQQVADRYIQGPDGRWYKADAWTLYGSTYYASSPDDVSRSTSTLAPTASTQMDSVLPAGWPTSSQSNRTDSIIILSLAIVLAVSICLFIISCIVWRKRRKKILNGEKKKNDLELKARHKVNLEDLSEDGEKESEARGKNRLWARASARWKANIRHSARRRRRRHGLSTRSRPQSPALLDPHEVSARTPSPVSSQRHSIAPVSEDIDNHTAPVENSLTPTQRLSTPDSSSSRSVLSPPAYMFPVLYVRPEIEGQSQEVSHVPLSDPTSRRGSLPGDDFPPADHDDIPYHPSRTGHVAIDDKTHLSRMAELASAPPVIQNSAHDGPSESAPEWHDEFEDHPSQSVTPAPFETSLFKVGDSGFPKPPSKSVLSPGYFDGHSYLQDITALDPISLPSMPPYEAQPNVIPFEDTLAASAPPLSEDDQWEGSAPEASEIYGDECDTPSSSLPSLSSAFSSQASAPPEELVDMHGVLPIYQP